MWHRHQRESGAAPYRQVFTGSTIWLACVVAQQIDVAIGGTQGRLPSGVMSIVGVLAAIVGYAALNTGLVYAVMWLSAGTGKRPPFLNMWQDKALEIATLCLAGLAALALTYQPWLTVLVIPSMVVLQRSVLTKELQVAATTDSKTGLLNAVTWHQLAERELARATREQRAAAMLIVDMDNFKLINDTYGHLVGDAVLKAVAEVMTDELRGYDTIGRFGGEEFVALLADVSPIQALDISDRILTRIRELNVGTRGEPGELVASMSASIGIACYPQQGTEVEDLLHVADAALYTAKREGRDRVEYSYVGD
jgi:diguanylate cyclase (GGDEF)-like protein